jgi:hypothetical protein
MKITKKIIEEELDRILKEMAKFTELNYYNEQIKWYDLNLAKERIKELLKDIKTYGIL